MTPCQLLQVFTVWCLKVRCWVQSSSLSACSLLATFHVTIISVFICMQTIIRFMKTLCINLLNCLSPLHDYQIASASFLKEPYQRVKSLPKSCLHYRNIRPFLSTTRLEIVICALQLTCSVVLWVLALWHQKKISLLPPAHPKLCWQDFVSGQETWSHHTDPGFLTLATFNFQNWF